MLRRRAPLRRFLRAVPLACLVAPLACQSNGPTGDTASAAGPIETRAPAAPMAGPSVILVSPFHVVTPDPDQSADSSQTRLLPGVLHGLRSGLSQAQLAGELAGDIASELRERGFNARSYDGGSLPGSGWLVQGSFIEYQSSSQGILARDFAKTPVELVVTVDDLGRGEPPPIVQFNVAGDASGIGAPMMPNPYAAAAKFVVRQVELGSDSNALADRVASEIARFASTNRAP